MKAISLFSGGLDSILATRLVADLGIEVEAVHFKLVFLSDKEAGKEGRDARKMESILKARLTVMDVSEPFLEVVRHPRHGYGKNMNPCIDCKIFMIRKAKAYMEEAGASFLITGEVLGERPMSQRKDILRVIEREAGADGLILRPLSARLLPPSIPEIEGWVDREKMLDIQGRSRKPQIRLADEYRIKEYPAPAGGCLLTDPGFSKRMEDLMAHHPDFNVPDVRVLKVGRHFRLSPMATLIVGRDERENQKIEDLARDGDFLFRLADHPGPVSLLRGECMPGDKEKAAAITARFSKAKNLKEVDVTCRKIPGGYQEVLRVEPLPDLEKDGVILL
jgi:tRNA U34 2-thiouridine synthase MnmA/TrmU